MLLGSALCGILDLGRLLRRLLEVGGEEDKAGAMSERLTRIAIVSSDRCKPKKCRQECKKSCPVVKTGFFFTFPSIPNFYSLLFFAILLLVPLYFEGLSVAKRILFSRTITMVLER